jgi:hypothetical protein
LRLKYWPAGQPLAESVNVMVGERAVPAGVSAGMVPSEPKLMFGGIRIVGDVATAVPPGPL